MISGDYEKNVFFNEILSILNHEISLYFLSKAYLVLIRKKTITLLNIELILDFFVCFKPLHIILLDKYIFNKQKNILKQLLVKTFLPFLLF